MTKPDITWVDLFQQLRTASRASIPDAATISALTEQLHARYLELSALGGTTPGGLPYPAPTDPVAQGADAIRALAEAIDSRPRGRVKRSGTAAAITSAAYFNASDNSYWTADEAVGVSAYAGGWKAPVAGRYRVEYSFSAAGAFLAGISINSAAATPTLYLRNSGQVIQGGAHLLSVGTQRLVAGDVIRPYLLAAAGTPAWETSTGHFQFEFVGP